MFIDIKEIGREGKSMSGELALSPLNWQDEEADVSKVAYNLFAEKSERGILLSGLMDATVSLRCSRCSELYPLLLHVPFSLTLVEECRERNEGDHQLNEDKTDYFPLKEGKADLNEVLAEQIYLNIPLKPLCSSQCKGLCARCGENLNRGRCGCFDGSQP